MTFLGALPARFRRERVLIIGCGDVGQRAARELGGGRRVRLLALTSNPDNAGALRGQGITPLIGNLDRPADLQRLAGLATRVLHLAPPPSEGQADWQADARTRSLVRTLARRSPPSALVYGSTTGVYGNCEGRWVDESAPTRPLTPRAWRRVDAEASVHWLARALGVRSSVLRIPGIYAGNREGGTPVARLRKGLPLLQASDDVYTNHIQADDLARACVAALWRGRPQRVVHASDDTEMYMADYVDLAADLCGLPRPPRISRTEAQGSLPVSLLSFMGESRRLRNRRLKTELRVQLHYPTVVQGLAGLTAD